MPGVNYDITEESKNEKKYMVIEIIKGKLDKSAVLSIAIQN